MPAIELLQVRIDPELKAIIKQAADKRDISINRYVTDVLERWFYSCDALPSQMRERAAGKKVASSL